MTMRITSRRALAATAALGALIGGGVAVSGCGAAATIDPVAQAAEVTSRQAGARMSLSVQFSSSALPSGFGITASGYIDPLKRTEVMNMDLSGVPGISALPGGGSNVQMIFAYPLLYMNMPFLAGRLPEGKTWMEIDVSKAAQAAGLDGSQLSSVDQWDPSQYLNFLRGSSGSVVAVDRETVDGVLTTHYRANLQVSKVVEHLSGGQQASAKAALEKLGVAGALPVDVWVDGQGRVRREVLTLGGAASAGAAAAVSGTITVDFLSFGPVPPVAVPPASEVFDATSLAAGEAGSGSGGL
jgi:hypothetical protein